MLSMFHHLKGDDYCFSVDLFNVSSNKPTQKTVTQNEESSNTSETASRSDSSKNREPKLSLIVDSESCLDRLYGGYYSDWASGGQWNRMLGYIGNLHKACQTNNIELTVAIRGGVEKEHAASLFKANRDFKERLNRVILHLQNRGTPPPKVWWLPPTCLREVLSLALNVYGIPVLSTHGDYYTEVMSHLHSHDMDGLLTDDPHFVLLNPPRLFAAHDFKLTYKGSLETKEYLFEKWCKDNQVSADHFPLLGSLLGNHIISPEIMKEFHLEITGNTEECKTAEEIEHRTITEAVKFVRSCSKPALDLESVAQTVFKNSCGGVEEGLEKLKQSIAYIQSSSSQSQPETPNAIRSSLSVQPVKSDRKHRGKKNAVLNDDYEPDDSTEESSEKETSDNKQHSSDTENSEKDVGVKLEEELNKLTMNGDMNDGGEENGVAAIAMIDVDISPNDAVLKLALERHTKGLMSQFIIQALTEREVRLPCYMESMQTGGDRQTMVEIYRPIRQSVYAILHNLNKHLYDTRKQAEEHGNTISADDITIKVVEHYLGPLGADIDHELAVKPVSWPVPSVESLWLGVKPENKMRRMKAFMSCMEVGQNPYMSNTTQVPERFILICTVLRYLLKRDSAELTVSEVDAVLAMVTSNVLFDVQTMQDMQLPLINPRGAHVASLVMAGLQHAMLVNDVCGAPVRKQMSFPWLCFDGKLLQYKLLKATSASHGQRLDLCDGQMAQVIVMERLRQAVWHGLEDKLGGEKIGLQYMTSTLTGGRVFAAPTAYLRPSISSHGRGKGSLMGEFMPVNSRLDNRGGKLQVAGQVVATWGPRPGTRGDHTQHNHVPTDYQASAGFGSPLNDYHPYQPYGYHQHHNHHHHHQHQHKPPRKYYQDRKHGYNQSRQNKNRNQNANNSEQKPISKKPVMIATKTEKVDEAEDKEITENHGVNNLTNGNATADELGGASNHTVDTA